MRAKYQTLPAIRKLRQPVSYANWFPTRAVTISRLRLHRRLPHEPLIEFLTSGLLATSRHLRRSPPLTNPSLRSISNRKSLRRLRFRSRLLSRSPHPSQTRVAAFRPSPRPQVDAAVASGPLRHNGLSGTAGPPRPRAVP